MFRSLASRIVDSSGHQMAPRMKSSGLRPRIYGSWSPNADYTPIAIIGVPQYPFFTALTSDNTFAWVTNYQNYPGFEENTTNTVYQIDVSTNALVNTVTVGDNPVGVALTPDNTAVWVTNISGGTISIIDTTTLSVTTLSTGPITQPFVIAASSTNTMWVTGSALGDPILEVDIPTQTVIQTVTPSPATYVEGLAVGPNYVWVGDTVSNQIYQIDAGSGSIVNTIPVPYQPTLLALSPDNSFLWVTHINNSAISQINVTTGLVITTIPVLSGPVGITVSPDSQYVWVACFTNTTEANGVVVQIDVPSAKVVNVITEMDYPYGPYCPVGITVDPSNASVWVTDPLYSTIYRFPIMPLPIFGVQTTSFLNYSEVPLNLTINSGDVINLSDYVHVSLDYLHEIFLTYSIYSGSAELHGSILTVANSGFIQILVRSSQVEDIQSSGAILLSLSVTVNHPTILCNGGFVAPNYTAQLSGDQRTSIRSATTIYDATVIQWNRNIATGKNQGQPPRFKNTQDYIAYKKARTLANATPPVVAGHPARPPPTSLLLNPPSPPGCGGGGGAPGGL